MMTKIRLQKHLAECGIASRRKCELLIEAGKVRVNDTVALLGQQITPGVDRVEVNGKAVVYDEKIYLILNKPAHVITTAKDTHGRKTVMQFLQGIDTRVFPVGRLDADVEGALLFTNDGDLAFRLLHPSFKINKVYMAWVRGHVKAETLQHFKQGIRLEEGMTAPAEADVLKKGTNSTLLRLVLYEGKKREVKRMCAAVGHPIKKLHRVSFADIQLKGLRPGEWRRLSTTEVQQLFQSVGLQSSDA